MADEPEITGEDVGYALGQAMIAAIEQYLVEMSRDIGDEAALAFAFSAISVCSKHLALSQGAAFAIDYLDDIAKPLRDFLTMHGGPGVGMEH